MMQFGLPQDVALEDAIGFFASIGQVQCVRLNKKQDAAAGASPWSSRGGGGGAETKHKPALAARVPVKPALTWVQFSSPEEAAHLLQLYRAEVCACVCVCVRACVRIPPLVLLLERARVAWSCRRLVWPAVLWVRASCCIGVSLRAALCSPCRLCC